MPNSQSKPYVFLACTEKDPSVAGRASCEKEFSAIADLLEPLSEEGGVKVLQARDGSRIYFEDVLFQKQGRDQIDVLYVGGGMDAQGDLVFASRSGEVRLKPQALAELIAGFGNLKLVILSGTGQAVLAEALAARGVAAVLAVEPTYLVQGVALEYFFQLIQGQSLQQALESVQTENTWHIRFEEVGKDGPRIRPQAGGPGAEALPFQGRFLIPTGAHEALEWRLRNPLLISMSEKDRWARRRRQKQDKPDEDTTKPRSRRVRRNRPYPAREWQPAVEPPPSPEEEKPKNKLTEKLLPLFRLEPKEEEAPKSEPKAEEVPPVIEEVSPPVNAPEEKLPTDEE
ncbi:MAG: hypothetical protein D6722_25725, partial [Bacteroidetes bacterium]